MEKYRSDIDGLRAIAVASVVLYHAGVTSLRGGYVGVDVFFVISGYLITRYVDQKIGGRNFSIAEFYERRIRRIMPALFFVLLVSLILGYFALLPNELYNFSKGEIATTLFAPNIFFYGGSGYFDTSARLKPLLHMWSLGVEEQFYIFLPLTMILASRGGRRGILTALYAGFAGSLVLSVWAVRCQPDAAFYLVPFRAWELLVGSLIGVRAFPRIDNALLRNTLSAMGVVLIFASFFLYTPDTPFPGFAALLPCLGAGLVIYGGEAGQTATGWFLSWRPMVGLGLISYSLYLWHWLLLVLTQQFIGRPLNAVETALVVLWSLAAAIASWKYVEQPFRRRLVCVSRGALFSTSAAVAAVIVVMAAVGIVTRGLPQRVPVQAVEYASAGTERDPEIDGCRTSVESIQKGELCRLGLPKSGTIDFVVWGDSHAGAIAPAFRTLANESGTAGWLSTKPACAPLLGVERISHDSSGCDPFNDAVLLAIERYDVRTVFLVGRWEVNALGRTSWETSEGLGGVFLRDESSRETSAVESRLVFERGLIRTLSRLNRDHRSVTLIMDVPNTATNTPVFLAKSAIRGGSTAADVRIDVVANGGRFDPVDVLLTRLCKQWHAQTIDPKRSLCSGSECLVARNGRSLYRDDHHLSVFGALQLVDLIRPSFGGALSAARSGRAVAALQIDATPPQLPSSF
jgi:peptidoglycan/LPS O-acetylase OafA/YrhL